MASISQQQASYGSNSNGVYLGSGSAAGADDWFVAPATQDVWLDKTGKELEGHAWTSDSSSVYSLSPSDQYRAMFDSDLLLNNTETLDSSTTFTMSNNVSTDNSPLMTAINPDNGFDLIKNEFTQLPIAEAPVQAPAQAQAQAPVQVPAPVVLVKEEPEPESSSLEAVAIEDKKTQKKRATATTTGQKTQNRKRCSRKRLTADQRETHNMIEKRYRININTKIGKLQKIIPWVACEDTAFVVDNKVLNNGEENVPVKSMKLNKSMILEKAVDYILYLQNNERLFELEVQRLRKEINELKAGQAQAQGQVLEQ